MGYWALFVVMRGKERQFDEESGRVWALIVVNVPPVWFLALIGIPLAAWLSYWLVNRPS
jgi:hypothetical protein